MFEGGYSDVTAESMACAASIVAWHLHEARRVLPQLALRSKDKQLLAVDQWLIRQCRQTGTNCVLKNDLRQRGPLRSTQELDSILSELASLNRLRVVEKKPTTVDINPALLGSA